MSQDYGNLERLISDNASSDSTEDLCRELCKKDRRIRYIQQQTNRGLEANFREVLSQARGEYFMWLSDDDWLDSTYVSNCATILEGDPEHVLVCGKDRYYRGEEFMFDGPRINLAQESPQERVVHYFQNVSINGMFYGLMRRNCCPASTFLQCSAVIG